MIERGDLIVVVTLLLAVLAEMRLAIHEVKRRVERLEGPHFVPVKSKGG